MHSNGMSPMVVAALRPRVMPSVRRPGGHASDES